ncbi:MAG: hypothetical protein Q8899_01580 [Weeping tea tree witches'-broom phytoplasma]|uniref:hypothetical protein n=1 Tax=Candidatus Phytoplasma melaleucae TaxID=2982630 RepID=UPI00293AF7AA|nr:hypothetical protein [Weeping tea tree witches'-broom phytoplasma]
MNKKIKKDEKKGLIYKLSFGGQLLFWFILVTTFFTIITDFSRFFLKNQANTSLIWKVIKVIFLYYRFFTNQKTLLVFLVLCSFLVKIKNQRTQSFFILMIVVDSLLTTFVYNCILSPIWNENGDVYKLFKYFKLNNGNTSLSKFLYDSYILSIFQHIIIPWSSFFFFFFYLPISLTNFKKIFYTFFHPLFYLFCYFICLFEPIRSQIGVVCSASECWFPYSSIQCDYYEHSKIFGDPLFRCLYLPEKLAVLFRILILFIIFAFFFLMVFYWKNKFNCSRYFKKTSPFVNL